MKTPQVTGRLWITTAGEGDAVPFFSRTTVEEIILDVPEEYAIENPRGGQMSIFTEAGETYDPISDQRDPPGA